MIKRLALPISILLLLLLQVPFLQADPDGLLAWHSRGAYTDEGLYTSQIRNYVNHSSFNINETDGFAKAPLFSVYLLPYFVVLGTHLWVARLAIFLFFGFTLYKFAKSHLSKQYQALAVGIIGLQYLTFNYSHFAMAEILAASCILWILHFYLLYTKTGKLLNVVWASVFGIASVLVKTNHLFVTGILPVVLGITMLWELIRQTNTLRKNALALTLSIGVNIASALLVFLIVYLPNKALYLKIYNQEVSGKFEPTLTQLLDRAAFNWSMIESSYALSIPITLMGILIILFIAGRFKAQNTMPAVSTKMLLFCGIWLLVELHKLPVLNLPARYLVSTFLAVSVLSVALLEQLHLTRLKRIGLLIAVTTVFIGLNFTVQAYSRRSFVIRNLNHYVAQRATKDRIFLGTWAPTACWESKNITMPVWEHYFNDKGFMNMHPQAIITEYDERDAGYIFSKSGLNLNTSSDSSRDFTIEEWVVRVNWLKN
jgi:hypothetical protein